MLVVCGTMNYITFTSRFFLYFECELCVEQPLTSPIVKLLLFMAHQIIDLKLELAGG
jgi:hypothetical protein